MPALRKIVVAQKRAATPVSAAALHHLRTRKFDGRSSGFRPTAAFKRYPP